MGSPKFSLQNSCRRRVNGLRFSGRVVAQNHPIFSSLSLLNVLGVSGTEQGRGGLTADPQVRRQRWRQPPGSNAASNKTPSEKHREVQTFITATAYIVPASWHTGKPSKDHPSPSLRSETRQSHTKQARTQQRFDLPRLDTYTLGGLCP